MSNALALAAITATLTGLLDDDLAKDLSSVDGRVEVTAKAPDLIQTEGTDQRQLNLFLYQVTPNPGWANLGLPARDGRGERTANPPLALDLHYLLTAYASGSLQAESILGHAMLCLHEWSVVPRKKLEKFQEGWQVHHDALVRALSASGLADQVEQIKICPEPFGVEELSKLWTAFQTSYRPTVAYRVSVVLIESALPARSALPVLKRGPKDRGAQVSPDLTPPFPTLIAVTPPQRQPSVRLGQSLILSGCSLLGEPGDRIQVRAENRRLSAAADLELLGNPAATEIRARLPNDDPERFPAGNYVLTIDYSREDKGEPYRTTNQLPFSLAPMLTLSSTEPDAKVKLDLKRDAPDEGKLTLKVECIPHVWQGQRASLLLNDREAIAETFTGDKTGTLTFVFADISAGDYWVRLRVDGVESLLVKRDKEPPEFDATQRVTIP